MTATGELKLFKEIYEQRNECCEITGQWIPFNVNNFAHILGKGAYPSFRLLPENILMVQPRIHHLYDNVGREKLLAEFPEATIIYELKDKLRRQYYGNS